MKKNIFKLFIINKKTILIILAIAFFCSTLCFVPNIIAMGSPKAKYTVVIDAGHGGIDGGSVGISTGVSEAELNLDYALTLREYMQDFGFNVVMTRTTSGGLYSPFASNKKKDDMKKRKDIIDNANADFVVSIHMNSFSGKANGAQVFYGKDDEPSKNLASNIQKYFLKYLQDARKEIKVGDYYVLNAVTCPSVLVECGYLSNATEEALLLTEDYKKEVCYSILLGVIEYFN